MPQNSNAHLLLLVAATFFVEARIFLHRNKKQQVLEVYGFIDLGNGMQCFSFIKDSLTHNKSKVKLKATILLHCVNLVIKGFYSYIFFNSTLSFVM